MVVMIYALYTYHWRAASIRRGGRGPYDDRLGPVSYFSDNSDNENILKLRALDGDLSHPSQYVYSGNSSPSCDADRVLNQSQSWSTSSYDLRNLRNEVHL
jgi:hypothetical protein